MRVQMVRMMVWVMVRMEPYERDGCGSRGGRSHRGQCQHVLRRAQLLGQAPRLHGRRDPVRMSHLMVHGRGGRRSVRLIERWCDAQSLISTRGDGNNIITYRYDNAGPIVGYNIVMARSGGSCGRNKRNVIIIIIVFGNVIFLNNIRP